MSGDINQQEQREHVANLETLLDRVADALEGQEDALEGQASLPGFGGFNVTYAIPVDFGSTGSYAIKGHPSLRGKVVDFTLAGVTEALDSASEVVNVGDAGDPDEHAVIAIGSTVSIGASAHPAIVDGVSPVIPIGQDILVANTSAGTEGIGTMFLTIAYFN